jgi:hypothetical protein
MVPVQVVLIAAAFGGLWYAGHKTVSGVKRLDHAVASKLHHKKAKIAPTTPIAVPAAQESTQK